MSAGSFGFILIFPSFLFEKLKELGCVEDSEVLSEAGSVTEDEKVYSMFDENTEDEEFGQRKDRKRKADSKKPKNPFFLYCSMERHKLRASLDRELMPGEATKILGQKWNNLSPEEKQGKTVFLLILRIL